MKHLHISPFVLVGIGLLSPWLLSMAPAQDAAPLQRNTTPSCIHLLYEGRNYSASYFRQPCLHRGYTVLPANLYDQLHGWTVNAVHAKILSQLDAFAINARLATQDTSFERVSAGIGHSIVLWPYNRYHWTKYAGMALAFAKDALGKSSPLVKNHLEDPFLKIGVARTVPIRVSPTESTQYFDLKDDVGPTDSRRAQLVGIFLAAEQNFSPEKAKFAASMTLEQAATQVPTYVEQRRKNLGLFTILRE